MRSRAVLGSRRRAWSAGCGVALLASVLVGMGVATASAAVSTTTNANGAGGGRVFDGSALPAPEYARSSAVQSAQTPLEEALCILFEDPLLGPRPGMRLLTQHSTDGRNGQL